MDYHTHTHTQAGHPHRKRQSDPAPAAAVAEVEADLAAIAWRVTIAAPHDSAWSKNRTWRQGRGNTFLDQRAKAHRNGLALQLRGAIRSAGYRVAHNRLWVGLHVAQASLAGDATNALPLVLDAVQLATDLDDRWAMVERVTWALELGVPHLVVTVAQADLPDVLACTACRRLLPFDSFRHAPAWPPLPPPTIVGTKRTGPRRPRDRATCLTCCAARKVPRGTSPRLRFPP